VNFNTIEKIALSILFFQIAWVLYYYTQLPESIAIHFNSAGNADGWGSKIYLFLMPVISIGNFALIKWAKSLGKYNTHKPADPKEMEKMVDHINLSCQLIFAIISFQMVRTALSTTDGLGGWVFPIFLILIAYPFIFYYRATKGS